MLNIIFNIKKKWEITMELLLPSFDFIPNELDGDKIIKRIERIGRVCYKSENKITADSAQAFVKKIIRSGHHSVIEHVNITVKFIIDRGISHELVRHRIGSYSQESSRYCLYDNHVKFIIPSWLDLKPGIYNNKEIMEIKDNATRDWAYSIYKNEEYYHKLIKEYKWKPGYARSVLPNALKTEIVATFNLREWRHVLNVRCGKGAHDQIREVMIPVLNIFIPPIAVISATIYRQELSVK